MSAADKGHIPHLLLERCLPEGQNGIVGGGRKQTPQPVYGAAHDGQNPQDKDTVKFLTKIGHPYKEGVIKLTEITSENQRTKLVIRNYPFCLPLTFMGNLPSVLKAERNYYRNIQKPRNQVTVLWEGEPPVKLQLPGIRPLKVERYVGKPTFCGRCQKWGNRIWECDKKREVQLLLSEPRHKNLQRKINKWRQLYRNVPTAPRNTTHGAPSVP